MRRLVTVLLILFVFRGFTQENLKELSPEIGVIPNLTLEAAQKFNSYESIMACEKVWERLSNEDRNYDQLTPDEWEILQYCDESREFIWEIFGTACSWYCAGGPDTIYSTSHLPDYKTISYNPYNAQDNNMLTAWVEGAKGYGIGESITYHFPANSPRITEISLFNGYIKKKDLWKDNSRVKQLKMYVDGKPFVLLHLADTMATQTFFVDTVGRYSKDSAWTITFEIRDVYKGKKHDDTAITELFFNGIDVHCFAAGTMITMADSSLKAIEKIVAGDKVLSLNLETMTWEEDEVLETASAEHDRMIQYLFEGENTLRCTPDHPLLGLHKKWYSVDNTQTERNYQYTHVLPIQAGDILFNNKVIVDYGYLHLQGPSQTYTIVRLKKNKVYLANDIAVGTE